MNRLEEILRAKRKEVERLKPRRVQLEREARARKDFRAFREALARSGDKLAVIAEVKKASPSAGVIADSFDPVRIARNYEEFGANAVSVLTDARFFQGNLQYLADIRNAVGLPLLRKDFTLDEIQIAESAATGADAILLIVAALEQARLIDLVQTTFEYNLDALVEVHTRKELERALKAGAKLLGINNRNLSTFEVDLAVTEDLCREVPDEVMFVSESGIKTREDVARMKACGADAVLVGEALMRGELSLEQIRSA